ncbi:glutamyl-tRNA reductase [Rhodocytophaga aerolata]|uniref:Glutamyl-tRNA reductase n=1 Tax=Rhodocytophaga aerolata TaxID=455078 RepID=A0ABT8REU5_9BACT|nr:glutamyl-tRNA reductase [Rhodocytophaga aerolata]MDO1450632.1 glutamyl-tRNA reductase [Rhodocytophaga aerolata]
MNFSFKAVSLSYKTAPIHIRESVALNESECKRLLTLFKNYIPSTDILVLSTCNRTEVYYQADQDFSSQIISLIALEKGIMDASTIFPFFTIINSSREALRHLFNVSLGLESQVVGDLQISNQVKRAYQYSADEGMAGPFLHRLMHTIFFTNKKVVQETCFRDGAASVSYATVELVKELTADTANPVVLILGLGEIGTDVCKNLCKAEFAQVKIANRTAEKAIALAKEYAVEVIDWQQAAEQVQEADVIISAIPGLQPFLLKSYLQTISIAHYKGFIDLSMPRSIEESVEEIPGVLLYNIDNIKNKASEALEKRKAAIPQVKEIIEEAIAEFTDWSKEMVISPVINKFKETLDQIRQQEINRYAKSFTAEESKKIDLVTKNIIQKILKMPILELKAACKRGEADQISQILKALFDLEQKQKV